MSGFQFLSNLHSLWMHARHHGAKRLFVLSLLIPVLAVPFGSAAASGLAGSRYQDANAGSPGAVFTITNVAAGNEVVAFDRFPDGTLVMAGAFATGGLGSGSGLGSQGALALSEDHQWLAAVNAGSNEISVFSVSGSSLALVDKTSSGGILPISVAVYKNRVYVLNAGGSGNITGFKIAPSGRLHPLPNSTRNLSNGGSGDSPGPAQISFSPNGAALVVTEKATNLIDLYQLGKGGYEGPFVYPSAGQTPFGFAFGQRNTLIVSEAFGGAPNLSALSSYRFSNQALNLIDASVPTHQTAACWVVVTEDGRFTYTTNAGSSSISGYQVDPKGHLTLLDEDGITASTGEGSSPLDMALANNSRFLYALSKGTNTITGFEVLADGSLNPVGSVSIPDGSVGLTGY